MQIMYCVQLYNNRIMEQNIQILQKDEINKSLNMINGQCGAAGNKMSVIYKQKMPLLNIVAFKFDFICTLINKYARAH